MEQFVPLQRFYHLDHSSLTIKCDWSNCNGKHLIVEVPDGDLWDVDHRAINCSAPWDREHRCWVRHGELPFITINKNGYTCDVGGGSVLTVKKWHGFLRNGNWYHEPLNI